MVCELTLQMTTVTNMLLAILSVRCAMVVTQYGSAQLISGTSSDNTVQQLTSIVANQRKFVKTVKEQDAAIERLRASFRQLQPDFECHFSPCQSCT